MQAVPDTWAHYTNWNVADPSHPIHRPEHMLTQEPKSLTVVQYPMNNKLVLSGELHWTRDYGLGRITGLVHRAFSLFWPCWKSVTTTIEDPALQPLFETAEREHSSGDERAPLVSTRRVQQIHPPFEFTLEEGNFYFYESESQVRSRAISEETLVAAICGSPQPHIGIATYHLQGISANGLPNIMVALKERGQKCDRVHTSIITSTIARVFDFDNRDKLVAVGEVREKEDSEVTAKFIVPKPRIITGKRIDVTVATLFGASFFGALVATYKTNPGAISITAGAISCFWLFQAYSRYHCKD